MKKWDYFLKRLFYFFVTKKMLISVIIALLIIILTNNVFAMEFTYNNNNYDLPDFDLSDTFFISYDSQSNLYYMWAIVNNSGNTGFWAGSTYIYVSNGPANCYYLQNDAWVFQTTVNGTSAGTSISNRNQIIGSSVDIYHTGGALFFEKNINNEIPPYFLDTDANLITLNMDYISIDSGNLDLYNDEIVFTITSGAIGSYNQDLIYQTGLNPQSTFYNSNGVNGSYYDIPTSILKPLLIKGNEINYILRYRVGNSVETITKTLVYNPSASTDDINNIINNNLSNLNNKTQQLINEQNETQNLIQEQTDAINANTEVQQQTHDFLTDDNISTDSITLPSNNNQDITETSLNNLFTLIYNAFCTGTPRDISIPIPYTNNSFIIPANLTSTILNLQNFNWVKVFIEFFWWFFISRYIVTDIIDKMNKIRRGDFEEIENSNIKGEML